MSDFDCWDKIFDKSKASKVPEKFPGDVVTNVLQLEDVVEEVIGDIDEAGHSIIDPQEPLTVDKNQHEIKIEQEANKGRNKKASGNEQKGLESCLLPIEFKKPIVDNRTAVNINKTTNQGINDVIGGKVKIEASKDDINSQHENEIQLDEANELERESEISITDIRLQPGEENPVKFGTHLQNDQNGTPSKIDIEPDVTNLKSQGQSNLTVKDTVICQDFMTKGRQISLEEAKNVRFLLFGSLTTTFTEEWTKQSIRLSRSEHYALYYHKSPAEAVILCIQAYLLKHVIFDEVPNGSGLSTRNSGFRNRNCLILALADILWQAGLNKRAVICLPTSDNDCFCSIDLSTDGVIEKLCLYEFSEKEAVQKFLDNNYRFFEKDGKSGCILFVYSVIMSRTIESVNEDIEGPCNCLVGQGSASQALINLLLVGAATPNFFNNSKEITNENGKVEIHYGISKRSEIGFLSFDEIENPKTAMVGSMLKTPVFPIWVLSLKYRTCVVFCRKRQLLSDWKLERRFDLHYHGKIPHHHNLTAEDVRLTIDTVRPFEPEDTDCEFNSCLEDTIRTKWQDCIIEWNGFTRF